MAFRRYCAAVACAATFAACGSTVPVGHSGTTTTAAAPAPTDGSDVGLEWAPDTTQSAAPSGSSPAEPTSGTPGGSDRDAPTGTSVAPQSATATAPEASGEPGGAPGRGTSNATPAASKEPVEVGIMVSDDAQGFYDALGLDGSAIGDLRAQARAVVDDINARGGFQGRKIEPVFANFQLTRAESYETQLQAICERWTSDHNVVAGIGVVNLNIEGIAACMGKRNALYVSPDQMPKMSDVYQRIPALFDLGNLAVWRMARSYVDVMDAQGFFKSDAKVGLLRFDSPASDAATENVFKPALEEHGLTLADEVTMTVPSSTSEVGTLVTQVQSAVLRFKTNGVTNVMTILPGAWVLFFMIQASNQDYYPQYGLTSYDWPHTLIAQGAPREQLRNSTAMGWDMLRDIPPTDFPFDGNPAATRCRQIMRKSGQPQELSRYCEGLFLLEAASRGASAIGGQQFGQAIENFDSSYRPVAVVGGRAQFSPALHDGTAAYRQLRFTPSCDCFAYAGPATPLP